MQTESLYRRESEWCRQKAEALKDPDLKKHWLKLAAEYHELADMGSPRREVPRYQPLSAPRSF